MREYNLRPSPPRATDMPQTPVDDNAIFSFGKHNGKPMGEIPVDYLAWCWAKFLHREPAKMEARYIIENIEALDRGSDSIFEPDPRKFRKK